MILPRAWTMVAWQTLLTAGVCCGVLWCVVVCVCVLCEMYDTCVYGMCVVYRVCCVGIVVVYDICAADVEEMQRWCAHPTQHVYTLLVAVSQSHPHPIPHAPLVLQVCTWQDCKNGDGLQHNMHVRSCPLIM